MFAPRWPQANVDQAKGVIDGARQSYTIGANDQLFSSEQYKPIVDRLSQRRAGAAERCGQRDRRDGKHAARGLDESRLRR